MEQFEEFRVKGEELLEKIRALIKEGNIRRLIIKNKGKTFLEVPLTVLTAAAVLAPYVTVLGLFGAMLTDCTIEVIRKKS